MWEYLKRIFSSVLISAPVGIGALDLILHSTGNEFPIPQEIYLLALVLGFIYENYKIFNELQETKAGDARLPVLLIQSFHNNPEEMASSISIHQNSANFRPTIYFAVVNETPNTVAENISFSLNISWRGDTPSQALVFNFNRRNQLGEGWTIISHQINSESPARLTYTGGEKNISSLGNPMLIKMDFLGVKEILIGSLIFDFNVTSASPPTQNSGSFVIKIVSKK